VRRDSEGGALRAHRTGPSTIAQLRRAQCPEARDPKPAGNNFLQQQAKFDDFIDCYNNERPHQALNMQCPAERYMPSTRPYTGLPELDYPFHDKTVTVTTCGRICFNRQKINLSTVFTGQSVGIKQVSEHIWLVTSRTMISATSTMSPAGWSPSRTPSDQKCYPCLRNKP
jgi:hypothetical protein